MQTWCETLNVLESEHQVCGEGRKAQGIGNSDRRYSASRDFADYAMVMVLCW